MRRRGITLIELLVALSIAGMMMAIAFPSVTRGLDGIRLRSSAQRVAAFLNAARGQAEREQAPVEIVIEPERNRLTAQSASGNWERRLDFEPGLRLAREEARRFVLLPGVPPPRFQVRLETTSGRSLAASLDPLTGVPQIAEAQ